MSFIDNAKEVLTSDEFAKLEQLNKKSADFDTTSDEDVELMGLKKSVKERIAKRDKDKNLEFIKQYTLADVLSVFKPTKEDWNKLTSELFPPVVSQAFAVYKIDGKDVEIKDGERILKVVSKAIQDGGIAQFITNLTQWGKSDEFIAKSHKADGGPYTDKIIFDNIGKVATRFKFDKTKFFNALIDAEIIKADKIKEEEPKEEPATTPVAPAPAETGKETGKKKN